MRTFMLALTLPLMCLWSQGCASSNHSVPEAQLRHAQTVSAIGAVLDDFHDAASKADETRYFAHFAPSGVFLGTDDSERWTVAEFRAYAHPHFSQGRGWTYTPASRHVAFTREGDAAWFDEQLDNAKYGRCRGSGVLLRDPRAPGGWAIAQYNLTVPIPNDLLESVAGQIRALPQTQAR